MTEDTVLQHVRTARDEYARSHGYDVQKIVADLRQLDRQGDWTVVRPGAQASEKRCVGDAEPIAGADGGRDSLSQVTVSERPSLVSLCVRGLG